MPTETLLFLVKHEGPAVRTWDDILEVWPKKSHCPRNTHIWEQYRYPSPPQESISYQQPWDKGISYPLYSLHHVVFKDPGNPVIIKTRNVPTWGQLVCRRFCIWHLVAGVGCNLFLFPISGVLRPRYSKSSQYINICRLSSRGSNSRPVIMRQGSFPLDYAMPR